MEKVVYTEVPTSEEMKKGESMPPPYASPVMGDEEALLRADAAEETCTPGRLCFASVASALFCFWPAALVGMVYSIKARTADSARAQRYLKIAKKCVWISFWVGVVVLAVAAAVHMAIWAQMAKHTMKGAMKGYVAGAYEGESKGALAAKDLMANGNTAKFPEQIPGQVNVFDVSSPFWAQIAAADDVKDAARLVGYSFGWVDGYKKGFCGTENADCTGVSMVAVTDYVHCDHMRHKMDKIKSRYMNKLEKNAQEDHEDDHEDKDENEESKD